MLYNNIIKYAQSIQLQPNTLDWHLTFFRTLNYLLIYFEKWRISLIDQGKGRSIERLGWSRGHLKGGKRSFEGPSRTSRFSQNVVVDRWSGPLRFYRCAMANLQRRCNDGSDALQPWLFVADLQTSWEEYETSCHNFSTLN